MMKQPDDDEETFFPDTAIELQYKKGESDSMPHFVQRNLQGILMEFIALFPLSQIEGHDKKRFMAQAIRTKSRTTSAGSTETADDPDKDTKRISSAKKSGSKLSAKQRRELRKKKVKDTQQQSPDDITSKKSEEPEDDEDSICESQEQHKTKQQISQEQTQQQPVVLKRGQKAKLKKIKEKYKDQDEEERQLRMEILASAGAPKEEKKKGKKGKQQTRPQSGPNKKQQQGQGEKQYPPRKLTVEDIKEESPTIIQDVAATESVSIISKAKVEEDLSDEEKQVLLEEENIQIGQDMNELDSLTGLPVLEDILHFCIPVCAPYSAILNYKFKVKLTPGTTKRGKAAKAALHSFMSDKNTTSREKDLFKSLKDVDLSRNIPGKVKVSAPNILKHKK
ncbi:hypothetical protein LSH36_382g02026 [Paralvinella palmiformis]|uniref:NFACT protein C-terminal domain-containing protein n=1 Tax=Paralvinella palmiformis TaxID=53620 RepID=A0AAD9N1M5_9ANNE|nr:hypothetical protein LSH36_382g02026 [Paralvinella palmiformis]